MFQRCADEDFDRFSDLAITPGTPFMDDAYNEIVTWAHNVLQVNTRIKIFISSGRVPVRLLPVYMCT